MSFTSFFGHFFSAASPKSSRKKISKYRLPEKNPAAATANEIPKIRVVFMGTPDLAATILETLIEKRYNIVGIVTKADRPAGRKKEISHNPVKTVALKHDIPLLQPEKIDAPAIEQLRAWKPDLVIVAAYGKILPQEVLDIPGFGCLNFHPSLLPKWRGAAPIQNALLAGATETGVTIMLMDRGMDTGDILEQAVIPIDPHDTALSLTEKLIPLGRDLLLKVLPLWVDRKITPLKQDGSQATLCQLIEREDGHIVWTDDAESISNRFRALFPWPGVFTYWKRGDELSRLKLIGLSYQKQNAQTVRPIGQVFEIGEKVGIQTTTGIIFLETVQMEGKTPLSIKEFLRGNAELIGSFLE